MGMGDLRLSEAESARRDHFIERLLRSTAGVFDIFTIYIGYRLGFYDTLADRATMTSVELATATGTDERYAREWLEQQTVSGILEVENPGADSRSRRFRLPPGHSAVLVSRDSLDYMTPLTQLAVSVTRPLDSVLSAYRNGNGVPLKEYGTDFVEGQAGVNRAAFLYQLGTEWLPAIPDLHERLEADPPARVADIGCGAGWSSIGIAQSYLRVSVDGFDLDERSIELAHSNLEDSDVKGRVNFYARDAGDPSLAGEYDLAIALECVHDMSNPVGALQTMRKLTADRGIVLVVDERVGESFTASGNDIEWMMYGWSVLHCLPVGMADQPSVGTGTVMRTDTLREYAKQAGFDDVEVLPIENFFFRFYRLH
jgi:2-polyprenyl-3-methyl-5-hydroxy-6-metoxy-1,4-benzoquinol methylase